MFAKGKTVNISVSPLSFSLSLCLFLYESGSCTRFVHANSGNQSKRTNKRERERESGTRRSCRQSSITAMGLKFRIFYCSTVVAIKTEVESKTYVSAWGSFRVTTHTNLLTIPECGALTIPQQILSWVHCNSLNAEQTNIPPRGTCRF